jgi:hypothetical protein
MQTSGDQRREIAKLFSPSLRAQRNNPPPRLPRYGYGLLRCARNDGEGLGFRSQPLTLRRPRGGRLEGGATLAATSRNRVPTP